MKRCFFFLIFLCSFVCFLSASEKEKTSSKTESKKGAPETALASKEESKIQERLEKLLQSQGLKTDDLEDLMAHGKIQEAIKKVSHIKKSRKFSDSDKALVQEYERSLRTREMIAVITESLPKEVYAVHKGDTLFKIEKSKHIPIMVMEQLNPHLSSVLQVGQVIQLVPWKCALEVEIEKKKLKLRVNDKMVRSYTVATGRPDSTTPIGTFKIINKIKHPTWYGKGVIAKPGDEANIVGTRWLGFDKKGYGIHGTTDPSSVGQATSSGCVRMKNSEVEELFGLVPLGTVVTIEK